MNGVPIAFVSRYLGHSSVNQTMVYAHLQPENVARAIAAVMSYYLGSKTDTKELTPAVSSEVPRSGELFSFNVRKWRNWQTHQILGSKIVNKNASTNAQ